MTKAKLNRIPVYSLEQNDLEDFQIYRLGGVDKDPPDLPHKGEVPHRHDFYEVFVFLTGGGHHLIDFKGYPIAAASLHFIAPGQVHLATRKPQCSGFLLTFSNNFLCTALNTPKGHVSLPFYQYGCNPILKLTSIDFHEFADVSERIYTEFHSENLLKEQLIRSYLNIILLRSKMYFQTSRHAVAINKTRNQEIFLKFQSLIEENFTIETQVSSYAEKLCVSSGHLNKISKAIAGKNASSHLKERITLECKRLLSMTNLPHKEIASQLGFCDTFYFNRFFKKNTGVTPGGFREKRLFTINEP